jgi:hypothetical protein
LHGTSALRGIDELLDKAKIRAAVRRVADDALLGCVERRIMMRTLARVAVSARRKLTMTGAEVPRAQVGVARLAIEAQAFVSAGHDHPGGQLVMAKGALSECRLRGRRGTAVLRRTIVAATGKGSGCADDEPGGDTRRSAVAGESIGAARHLPYP